MNPDLTPGLENLSPKGGSCYLRVGAPSLSVALHDREDVLEPYNKLAWRGKSVLE